MSLFPSSPYILTLTCPDQRGIVHAVSGFLVERGGNIEEAAQYNDHDTGLFFMRVSFLKYVQFSRNGRKKLRLRQDAK